MIRRFLNARLDKGTITAQGFLKAPAALTRTGVFVYRNLDGSIRRELRHPDDVFDLDSLETLKMVPVTDDHPKEFVSPENFKSYSVGYVSDTITATDSKIEATVLVTDISAIKKVSSGKVQLSCGYLADLIEESGEYNGEKYDVRQKI